MALKCFALSNFHQAWIAIYIEEDVIEIAIQNIVHGIGGWFNHSCTCAELVKWIDEIIQKNTTLPELVVCI